MGERFESVDDVVTRLRTADYLSDANIAGVVYLADRLGKPVLVEGPAGVGKTELAKAVSRATGAELVRLQCYEGLDEARALYEWNYKKQLLRIQAANAANSGGQDWNATHDDIFTEEFLLTRPLLTAIRREEPTVLLIDEVDKTDIEVEGLLLEVLGVLVALLLEHGLEVLLDDRLSRRDRQFLLRRLGGIRRPVEQRQRAGVRVEPGV